MSLEVESVFRVERTVRRVRISRDSSLVAVGCEGGGMAVCSLGDGGGGEGVETAPMHATTSHGGNTVQGLGWSVDGDVVYSAGNDGKIGRWELVEGRGVELHGEGGMSYHSLDVSADGMQVVVGGAREVRIFDTRNLNEAAITHSLHTGSVYGVGLSADGTKAVSCAADNTVRVWDVRGGAELHQFNPSLGSALDLAYWGGRVAVTGHMDHYGVAWDVEAGVELYRTGCQAHEAWGVGLSPDESKLFVSDAIAKCVRIHDIAAASEIAHKPAVHTGIIWTADWASNNAFAVTGSGDKTVKVFNAGETMEPRRHASSISKYTREAAAKLGVSVEMLGK